MLRLKDFSVAPPAPVMRGIEDSIADFRVWGSWTVIKSQTEMDEEYAVKIAYKASFHLLSDEHGRVALVRQMRESLDHALFIFSAPKLRESVIKGGSHIADEMSRPVKFLGIPEEEIGSVLTAHSGGDGPNGNKIIDHFTVAIVALPIGSRKATDDDWKTEGGRAAFNAMHVMLDLFMDDHFALGAKWCSLFVGPSSWPEDRRGRLHGSVYGRLKEVRNKDNQSIPGLFPDRNAGGRRDHRNGGHVPRVSSEKFAATPFDSASATPDQVEAFMAGQRSNGSSSVAHNPFINHPALLATLNGSLVVASNPAINSVTVEENETDEDRAACIRANGMNPVKHYLRPASTLARNIR